MKKLGVYLVVFPLITMLFLIALSLARSGALPLFLSHLLFVSAPALALMLLPAIVVWMVDVLTGRTLWCVIAGFVGVPLLIDAALYSIANPRILESIYFGIAGAVASVICRGIAGAIAQRSNSG